MGLGASEIAIVLVLVLVIFGPDRIPKVARSLGRAKRELEAGLADGGEPDVADRDERSSARPHEEP